MINTGNFPIIVRTGILSANGYVALEKEEVLRTPMGFLYCRVYLAQISTGGRSSRKKIWEAPMQGYECECLLGRDFFVGGLFTYDGINRIIEV